MQVRNRNEWPLVRPSAARRSLAGPCSATQGRVEREDGKLAPSCRHRPRASLSGAGPPRGAGEREGSGARRTAKGSCVRRNGLDWTRSKRVAGRREGLASRGR